MGIKVQDFVPTILVALIAGVLLAAVLWANGGCGHNAAAWRATAAVKAAGNLADDALADAITKKQAECVSKHCGNTDPAKCKAPTAYLDCIGPHKAVGMVWLSVVRPAINSSLQATVTGLTIAERVKLKPDFDWLSAIKPAVCAISRIAKQWGDYFGDKAGTIKAYLAVAEGVVCDD